jgi:hypothetical protein
MKSTHSTLAALASLRGLDTPPAIAGLLRSAGLPCSDWRAYRLIRAQSKMKATEATALAAVLQCSPADLLADTNHPKETAR